MRPRLRIRGTVVVLTVAILAIAAMSGWLAGRFNHRTLHTSPPGETVEFARLPGLEQDDLVAFLRAFQLSCRRQDATAPSALLRVCSDAANLPKTPTVILRFLTARFTPRRLKEAFFTGYYEPVIEASLNPTARFKTPLLALPSGVVPVKAGATSGIDPALTTAQRQADGTLVALPDRAGIETGALGSAARPIAFVEDPVEAFFIQVQGSARLKMPDGRLRRLVYAGRNGYPYTAIGRILVARYGVAPDKMGMHQLKAWIRDHGQGESEEGTRLMRENRSYIFFRFDDSLPPEAGPTGAEGVSLSTLRSLAIDHTIWPYGLPFYFETTTADGETMRHLGVAQDTGAAIKGAARADIFFGTGDPAAATAGAQRAGGTLYALWPREDTGP